MSMDGKGRYQDNIFVERLWRMVKYEEVYLKAYASVLETQRGLEDYFRFYNGLRPHQALGYWTPAEVFHGNQDVVEGDSKGRRGSPGQETQSLAGEPGFSLNSTLILSK
ncbi:MAG: transposase [Chloroflexi bacterium]|nr:transposase [Chloroflexota bacterium]MYE41312.1 transposase [Chloroflexota bacterium]